jgi:hypothetical protein
MVSWLLGPDAGGSRRTSRASAAIARGSSSSSCSVAMNSLSSACSTGHCHVRKNENKLALQFGSLLCLLHRPLSRKKKRETHCGTVLFYRSLWLHELRLEQLRLELYLELLPKFCHPRVYAQPMLQNAFFFWFALNGLRAPYTGSHEILLSLYIYINVYKCHEIPQSRDS